MRRRRPPTMEDVAREAGVSRSTVSRVFQNDGEKVSPDAQIRIREAAQQIGYVHNLVASGLAARSSSQLGLLIRDATNPAYGHLHSEMHRAVEATGRTLVSVTAFRHHYGDAELEGLRRLIGLRVSGLFVGTGVTAAEDLIEAGSPVPMMIVGRPNEHPRIESVSYDERTHGRMMAEHIAEHGHRRIAVLNAPVLYSRVFDLRVRSLIGRCRELGVTTIPVDLLPVDEGVVRALDAARDERLSCIVCPVDYVALDLLRAAQVRGIRIPEDVSTVGFDGMGDGLDLIGLATVRLPVRDVVSDALARMEELLIQTQDEDDEGPGTGRPRTARHSLHSGTLVPGRTLGPAPEELSA